MIQHPSDDESTEPIKLVGVRTHNLTGLDVEFPRGQMTVVTGVSGAGKSSLVFDTLYAEGQRRYVETFSAYQRQFLPQFDKPPIERVENIPPAIAIGQERRGAPAGQMMAEAAGILDYLRLLFARAARTICPWCQIDVDPARPEEAWDRIESRYPGAMVTIAFPLKVTDARQWHKEWSALREEGFARVEIDGVLHRTEGDAPDFPEGHEARVLLDRLKGTNEARVRAIEAIEIAFGRGGCVDVRPEGGDYERIFEGRVCSGCKREFPNPEVALFFLSNADAICPRCDGKGKLAPARENEVADSDPTMESTVSRAKRRRKKSDERMDLGTVCDACGGKRFRPEVLAHRLGTWNYVEILGLSIEEAARAIALIRAQTSDERGVSSLFEHALTRLNYLDDVGLGYLTLERETRSLSSGELKRVFMTTAFGGGLSKTLFVLDEPSTGLHPSDSLRLIQAMHRLRDRGNTLVVVEHDPVVMSSADWLISLGPGAGREGGRLIDQGPIDADRVKRASQGGRSVVESLRRTPRGTRGLIRLEGVSTNNLKMINVDLPLGVLCGIAGVSGSGKSSLVLETLLPALEHRMGKRPDPPSHLTNWRGGDLLGDVVVIDDAPLRRTPRANAATYLKIFDVARELFAETAEAKIRGLTPGDFSFNRPGGRCEKCEGTGSLVIDMQFLPEAHLVCPECDGRRYQQKVLEVKLRGLDVAEVLELTVAEAFGYFRGEKAILLRLKSLRDVGLDYLPIGQSLSTLSSGEAQRLKLAAYLGQRSSRRQIFLLDEPTTGLHPTDVRRLIECLESLVDVGHSVVVIEHDLSLLAACDHVIELGPGGGKHGGTIVAEGSPAQISQAATATGLALRSHSV